MTTPVTLFPADTTAPKRSVPTTLFPGMGDAPDTDTLTQAVRLGGSRTADNASRVLALQTQTGLSADVIERHLDDIERMTKERAFNPDDFRTKNPVVAAWMAEHPVNAAAAQDDLANLSRIEGILRVLSRGYQTGRAQGEQGRVGYDVMSHLGQMEPEQRDRLRQLDADIQREPAGRGFWTDVLYRGAQLVGQMADALPEVAEKSEVGLAGGLTASLATGPGAAVAAPVFGATGASVGAAAGFATYTYRVESGQAYLELGQLRGRNGETIDEDTKRNIALGVGMVNASLEMVGAESIIAPFRNATRSLFRQSVRDALERPTMRVALTQFGKAYATTLATETGQEVAQEISNVVGDELSKQLSGGNFETIFNSPEVREQTVQRLADIAEQTAKGVALVGLPGASLHGAATAVEARRALRTERYFTALGEGVSESKNFQRLPRAVQDIVARATADGPIETVYAPVEAVNTYFQSKKIDAAAVMREVTGSDESYQEALRTGGDVAIPMRRYAVTIAPSEHNSFFAKILRRSPSEMNALEAEEILGREDDRRAKEAAAGAPDADAAQQFEDGLTAQLMATGKFDESSARLQAKTLYSNVYRHVAERTGMSVEQLLQRLPVTVSAPENGPAPSAGPRIDLQAVADRAQAFREAQAERNAIAAEDAPQTPYDERVTRDPSAKTETNEWVYARTSAGALRTNLASVSTDGIVDEIARMLEAGQADRELETRFHAWNESADAAFVDALPDAERTGRSRRTTDAFGNKVKRQAEDLPDASGTMDPERLAAMRQLERDYHKASRTIEARKKIVAKLEAELARRGVTDVGERTFRRLTGGADLPDLTFQQSKLVKGYAAWAEAALDTHNSDEIREMARKRALAIQDAALAEYQADFNRANAEFAKKHGDEMASVFTDPAGLPRPRILYQTRADVTATPEFKAWFGNSKVVDKDGNPLVVYHGAQRSDRFGPRILKKRATSGPMPFFTDNPTLASSYATGKQDTSISPDDEDYDAWFRIKVPGSRQAVNLPNAWYHLTPEERAKITELAPRVTTDENGEEIILGPEDNKTGNGGYTADDYGRSRSPNPLKGLVEAWLNSGSLIRDEPRFMEVLKLAGVPVARVEMHDPWMEASGVAPVWLSIQRPLVTSDVPSSVVAALDQASRRQHGSRAIEGRGDAWSKDSSIHAAQEWMQRLREGLGSAKDSYAFTVIPDWVTRTLKSLGYDGVHDVGGKAGGEAHSVWVPFEPGQIKSAIANRGTFDPNSSNILHQGEEHILGQIHIKGSGAVSIALLAGADLSTFIHETGHFYRHLLSELAPDSPEMAADLEIVKRAVGWQDGQTQFTVAQEEQFAKSFEAYLYEGKSPSTELRGAFARFRAWLVSVYRSLAELHLTPLLSDEVRGVFDRLLASSDEIAAAEREQQSQPLFPDPKAVGMSEKQAAKYGAAWEDARQTAQDELARKVIADFQREQSTVYQAERAKVRADVAEEVNTERDSFAYSAIARGVLPDGSPLPAELEPFKLSKQALANEYAGRYPDLLKRLRARFLYSKEGGVHPDQAAEWFGYSSGDELVQALLAYEGTPKQRIERLTDQRVQAENPNLLTSAELAVEAVKAVHNEKRAQLLRLELEHLVTGDFSAFKGLTKRISRRLPSLPEMRAQAESMIAAKAIRDVSPVLYQRAEIKAARLAQAAFLDHGDLEAAYDEKLRELLNHELYRAAVAAKEESAKIAEYMARFTKEDVRRKLGKAGGDYLEQIDAIMERFDFRKGVTLSALNSRRSLRAWYDDQIAQGQAPAIPERLLDDAYKTHFREMTLGELRDVQTTVKSIAHLAQTKNSLLASARAREMESARTESIDAIGAHHKLNVRPEGHGPDTIGKRFVENVTRYTAEHTRMEFLFDFLDGYTGAGVVWQYFFKPFADAELVENEMRKRDAEAFKAIFGQYTRSERKRWFKERIYIPDAISAKHDGSFTKSAIIAAALNWGNQYNRDALLEGFAWTEAQAQAVLDKLDARDWETVRAVAEHINTYWPEVEALEKDINGIAPEKVEPTPFTTKYGDMPGWYYPILFDRERSLRQRTYDEKANVTEMFGGNAFRAMTRHGHTIERSNTGGKALRLTLTGMTDHLAQVTHDLAFRRAVIDVHRLVSDDEIREAIAAAAGKDMVDQLGPWLHAIAGDRQHDYLDTAERLFTEARAGATVVGLGLKVTSSLLQTLGFANTVVELGPKYASAGINDAFRHGNPFKLVADNGFIGERSKMMRDRLSNYDRDVRDYALRPDVLGAIGAHDSVWFSFVGYMDLATSIPTWLGAYRKGMDGKVESVTAGDERAAIDYADKVVRTTQAAGAAKDNATIQRGSPAKKLFTMFYSSLSIQFNQMDRARRQFGLDRNVPRLVGAFTMLVLVPAVLEDLVHGGGPDEDDDESWWAYLARKALLYPAQTIILARDIASSVDRYFDTGQKDFSGSPVLNVGQSVVNTAIAGVKALDPDQDLTEADWRAVFNTVGYIAKLPTAQVWKTAGYLYEWMTGNEQPENPFIGAYRAAVTGRPRQ